MARWKAWAILAAAAVFLAACGPVEDDADTEDDGEATEEEAAPSGEVTEGGELVVALEDDPDALDPTLARTLVGRTVFTAFCEKLYDVDPDLNVIPQLAADLPEASEDGLTVTISLREGLTFNDGTDFDAEAVKISIDRHRELEGSARAAELAPIQEVTVVDPTTVELAMSEPYSPLAATMADRAGMIMSPTQLDALGEDFADDPVCVGPFSFVERVAQDRIVFEKSEDYYAADEVHLDQVVYRPIPDGNVRAANLRSGEIHVGARLDPPTVAEVSNDENVTIEDPTSLGYQGISINVANANGLFPAETGEIDSPLGGDAAAAARRALELSLDRPQIIETVFSGLYTPGCSPIPPGSPYAPPVASDCPEQDIEQAQQLLAEAGLEPPVPVELVIGTDPQASLIGQTVQAMAGEAGFEVTLRPTEFAAALDQTDAGDYQAFQVGWSGRVDPDGNIYNFQASDGSLNITRAGDEEVDGLLADARAAQDTDERAEIYAQVVDLVRERANILYLWHESWITGIRNETSGVQIYSDGLIRVRDAGFTDGG